MAPRWHAPGAFAARFPGCRPDPRGYAPGTDIRVEIIREPSAELVDTFGRLLPRLSTTARPLDRAAADRLVSWAT